MWPWTPLYRKNITVVENLKQKFTNYIKNELAAKKKNHIDLLEQELECWKNSAVQAASVEGNGGTTFLLSLL